VLLTPSGQEAEWVYSTPEHPRTHTGERQWDTCTCI